jgi:hypothetical protein
MRTIEEIAERIREIQCSALLIDTQMNEEMGKDPSSRNDRLLGFLHKEKCCWEIALQQLRWMVGDQSNCTF